MARGNAPSEKQDQFMLRLPDGMRDQLREVAEKNGRSMNAEIVYRLASTLNAPSLQEYGHFFGIEFDEELYFELVDEAGMNKRTLAEEIFHRIKRSLRSEQSLVSELDAQAWRAQRDLADIMRLFVQMTPEERRILEERAWVVESSGPASYSSATIGKWTQLHRIGGKGRIILTKPPVDYSPLLPREVLERAQRAAQEIDAELSVETQSGSASESNEPID